MCVTVSIELFTSAVMVLLFVCLWRAQVERKKLEKEMGDLGLDMNDKDDVSSTFTSESKRWLH